jgi:hypothetical protein
MKGDHITSKRRKEIPNPATNFKVLRSFSAFLQILDSLIKRKLDLNLKFEFIPAARLVDEDFS